MAINVTFQKTSAQTQEKKGDDAVVNGYYKDALRAYKSAKASYEQLYSLSTNTSLENTEHQVCIMRLDRKIKDAEKALETAKTTQSNTAGGVKDSAKAPANSSNGGAPSKQNQQSGDKNKQGKQYPVERKTGVKFDDIVGLQDAKMRIKEALYPIKHPEEAGRYKLKAGGFIVLFGPPGTGKTSIARAITTEFDADMIVVKSSDVYSPYVGETESNIAALFDQVNSSDKFTVLYFDDGDTFFTKGSSKDGYQARNLNEMKTQLDGFSGRANTLVIVSCNNPEILDPAIVSRASNKIYVDLPDEEARKQIFQKELKGVELDEDVDLAKLASLTPLYSGRNIHNICESARKSRFLAVAIAKEEGRACEQQKVCQLDLLEALKNVRPDVTEKELDEYKKIAQRIASSKF